jgi:hypothetical protein
VNLVAIGIHVYLFIIWCLNDDVDNHAMHVFVLYCDIVFGLKNQTYCAQYSNNNVQWTAYETAKAKSPIV